MRGYVKIYFVTLGEMSEWLMELVLKTSDPETGRGFKSLSLRQKIYFIFDLEKYSSLAEEAPLLRA